MRKKINNIKKCVTAVATVAILAASVSTPVKASEGVPYITYTYDYYGDVKYTPAAYVPDGTVSGTNLGCGEFNSPQDINTDDEGNIYVADTGNNRVVVIGPDYKLKRIIDTVNEDGKTSKLSSPSGLYAVGDEKLYIADTENKRVIEVDENNNVIKTISNPKSDSLGDDFVFTPLKVAVDYADRVYVIAKNQFEGILTFNENGEFAGYTGTINVQITPIEKFWKKFSTKAQRSKQQLYIPTEFTGIEIDDAGFVYATNKDSEGEQSVRRLNPSGDDVIQQKTTGLSGDLNWKLTGDYSGPSQIVDVVVRDKGIYSIIDSARGRIFTYDHEGNLLYIFGGLGTQQGTFDVPTGIDAAGDEILVIDSAKNIIDKFKATEYGSLINEAIGLRYDGDEIKAVEKWKEVLKHDSNFELAYVGIGKSYLTAGNNKKAMECFETGNDKQYYSIAYKRYRNEILKAHLEQALTIVVILAIVLILWKKVFKKRFKTNKKRKEKINA